MAMDSSARESGMSVQEYALLGDRVRADTLLSDRVSSGDQGGMHWVRAAAIQATWSTSSSTVLLPWIFGTLGYLGGPLCLVVFVGLALVVQLKVVELAAEHGAMSDMADVGEALAGEPGRRLFRGLLLANQVLFMPCALVFCAHSLRGLVFPKGPPASLACHFYWTMMLVGVAFVVLQSGRRFGHASTLALATSTMCCIQVACIVAAVLRTRADGDDDDDAGYGPWPAADATWAEIFGAAGSIGYVYVPAFVTVDVMREMRAPEEMAKALTGATAYMVAIYVVVGLAPPLRWDTWRVADPVTDGFGASAPVLGRAANGLLLVACGLDYLLAALAVNGACRRALVPKLDLDAFDLKSCASWALVTAPGLAASVALSLFVPDLDGLVGLLCAVVVPLAQLAVPALLLLKHHERVLGYACPSPTAAALAVAVVVGAALIGVTLSSTIYDIAHTAYGSGSLLCELAG